MTLEISSFKCCGLILSGPATDPALKDLIAFSISVLETSTDIWVTLGAEGHSRSDGSEGCFMRKASTVKRCERSQSGV